MIEVKAFVCSYCNKCLTTSYDSICEHEKRCNLNPNKKRHSCSMCKHRIRRSYDETDRHGKLRTKYFYNCKVDSENKFDYIYDYCPNYEEDEEN